jgi:hypothetical protein
MWLHVAHWKRPLADTNVEDAPVSVRGHDVSVPQQHFGLFRYQVRNDDVLEIMQAFKRFLAARQIGRTGHNTDAACGAAFACNGPLSLIHLGFRDVLVFAFAVCPCVVVR